MNVDTVERTEPGLSSEPVDEPVSVVVADGEAERRRDTADALAAAGYRVIEAATGADAVRQWRTATPDVVVLDVDLNHGDISPTGIEVLRMLCRPHRREAPPVVITTSSDGRVDRVVECLSTGARDHLRSPFDPIELVARVAVGVRIADEAERLRRRNEELEYLGSVDDVTGLDSRRQVEDELARLGAAAARYHQPLAAVMLSVDRWEQLSRFGTRVTDAVLQEIAVLISAIGRTGDVAGRFAENSFLVLLPMTEGEGARVYAERARSVVAAAPILTESGPVQVSLSAGAATGAPGPSELLARARAALAQAEVGPGLVCLDH